MKKVNLNTKDNFNLSALYWESGSQQSILLLHMMPATKESWQGLAEKLNGKGFNVLAIDFRGHGESSGGNYAEFLPEQHQAYIHDAEAAVAFLNSSYPGARIIIGGASIGANIVIQYMSQHQEVTKGFCLSAGIDYYGVRAIEDITKLTKQQELLLVGARDDLRRDSNCGNMAEQLAAITPAKVTLKVIETGGHGNAMYASHPELEEDIINFLL